MVFYFHLFFLFCLTLWAAVSDVKTRIIPNRIVIPSFFITLLFVSFFPGVIPMQHLYSLLLMIALSVPLFSFGWMGGGDIKLLYVLAISFPLFSFLQLFFIIALAGGVQALIQMYTSKKKAMPYGVSIFLGYIVFVITQLPPHLFY